MNGMSSQTQQRLKEAREILKKKKQKSPQSPNYILIVVFFRKQTIISSFFGGESDVNSEPVTSMMANNNVSLFQINQIIRKRLNIDKNDSIQIFIGKKLLIDLKQTVMELRKKRQGEGPLELQVTKMEVF